ncbi:hypothetical protein [Mucilaginibacter sp. CSA2-8R]|uniref:hypothetical protein n=1 Tax=Mucilaginibacter sp. CSA2-8R TaxID=3141542 RepID=UPI00315C77A3
MSTLTKTFFLFAFILCTFCKHSFAQNSVVTTRAQNIFVELGGPGLLLSANYDTRFGLRRDGIGGRAGLGYISLDGNSILTVPLQVNYLLGKKGKYFEIGLGATIINTSGNNHEDFFSIEDATGAIGTMTFGYRYQPEDGGFNFRAAVTPIFNSTGFMPFFGGISFGYTF